MNLKILKKIVLLRTQSYHRDNRTSILIASAGTEHAPRDDYGHNMVQNIRLNFHFSLRGRPNMGKTQTVGGGLNSKRTERKNATSESLEC